jgi:hypothetical protein
VLDLVGTFNSLVRLQIMNWLVRSCTLILHFVLFLKPG